MINNTANQFQALTGVLNQLNNLANVEQRSSMGHKSHAQCPAHHNEGIDRGFAGSFSGLENELGQRYALSDNMTNQLLNMLSEVLIELIGLVINNANQQANTNNAPTSVDASNEPAQASTSDNTANTKASGGCPFLSMQKQEPPSTSANQTQPNQQGGMGIGQANNTGAEVADSRAVDFKQLSPEQRSAIGMSDRERAIVHLWGRQMVSAGEQNGGIYSNVLGADGTGSEWANKEEVALVKELRAKEQAEFGGDTGWMLDEMYFDVMQKRTGVDMSSRYADRPVNFSKGAIDMTNDINTLEQRTGISEFEQGVMRLMGHDALMDGQFDGSVLEYTVGNNNSLDGHKHAEGNTIDATAQRLLNEDINDDGERNGSSIMHHTLNTLDRLYS